MEEKSTHTFRDLTLREVWILIKIFCIGVFGCALVFVLPYVLFSSAFKGVDITTGSETTSKWIGYLIYSAMSLWIVFNIHEFFLWIGKWFTDLANLTVALSKTKRTIFAILFFLYFYCSFHFWIITFFVSVLVLLPASFTYAEYKRFLKEKQLEQK
jgi:hypothetical protein